MVFPSTMWILLVVSAVACSVGFVNFVYFLSIGYGFAVLAQAVAMFLIHGSSLSLIQVLQLALLILYGFRLSFFLLLREIKSASYKKNVLKTVAKPMPIFVKVAIWICVAALYVMQVSPAYYRMENGIFAADAVLYISLVIMAIGLFIETLADIQKSNAKKKNPKRFCDTGLYKMVRCPNYFGEILFWTGVWVSSFTSLKTAGQWIIATVGWICIVYVMVNGAQRLEKRQNKSYGKMEDYKLYVSKTPIIIPLIPVYSLNKEK